MIITGTGKINVWITELGKPCAIGNRTWTVAVVGCDGRILEWCGRRFVQLARCSHTEFVGVPPGRYLIGAAAYILPGPPIYWNAATDFSVVNVNCGEETCVTLYAPTYLRCHWGLILATKMLQQQDAIPSNLGDKLVGALQEAGKHVASKAPPIADFEKLEFMENLMAEGQKLMKAEQAREKEEMKANK